MYEKIGFFRNWELYGYICSLNWIGFCSFGTIVSTDSIELLLNMADASKIHTPSVDCINLQILTHFPFRIINFK